jgi:hypothetical protein
VSSLCAPPARDRPRMVRRTSAMVHSG